MSDPRKGTGRSARALRHAMRLAEQWQPQPITFVVLNEQDSQKCAVLAEAVGWREMSGRIIFSCFNEIIQRGPHLDVSLGSRLSYHVFDHRCAEVMEHCFKNPLAIRHAFDHDNRPIPPLRGLAEARDFVLQLETEFSSWRHELGADFLFAALKKTQHPEARAYLLFWIDKWTPATDLFSSHSPYDLAM